MAEMAKLSRIAPEVPVPRLRQAIEYYCNRLGFELAAEYSDGSYAIVERDGVAIHLFQQNAEDAPPVSFHVFTHGLEDLHTEFRTRGAAISQDIVRKPWGSRDFRVNDCAGNVLKFTELAA